MKKLIITLSIIAASLTGFSQDLGIKLTTPQDFIIIPAYKSGPSDSVSINSLIRTYTFTDSNGIKQGDVSVTIQYFSNGVAGQKMPLTLWTTFQHYADVTDAKIIARVKNKLNIP